MLLVKKCNFFSWFVFGQKRTRNKVKWCSRQKRNFFDNKKKSFQSPKNGIFPKGLTYAFGQKWIFFSLFVFGEKGLEIRFDDVLVRKETFFDFKNKLFQCLKNGIFPEGLTQAFGQKMQFLSLFVFAQNKIRSRAY